MDTALPEGRRGQILAAAIALTMLATLWFGVVSPLIGWYEGRADELSQRRALLSRMAAVAETLAALERQPDNVQPTETALLEGTTDALAAAAMQSAVQSMASDAGLDLTSMETLPAETRGNYRRIGLRVSLSASWPTLIELLRAAAQGRPHMLIDDLQVRGTPLQARSAEAPVNATFTLLAFRKAPAGRGS